MFMVFSLLFPQGTLARWPVMDTGDWTQKNSWYLGGQIREIEFNDQMPGLKDQFRENVQRASIE